MATLSPLPIDPLIPEVVESLARIPNAVVIAPPGAGKTTRLPPALTSPGPGQPRRRVVLLQPRRIAARAAAVRIAEERGWRLGEEVGYQIRFDNRTSPRTFLRVATEGILTRRIQTDPFLEGVDGVLLDEFHERSLHTDLALALLREVQTTVRPDLRIVVMSATLDPGPVAAFLGDAPVFVSEGRHFPVEIEYRERPAARPVSVWEPTVAALRETLERATGMHGGANSTDAIASAFAGHGLVFLPGIGEIRRVETEIRPFAERLGLEIHVLHSSISGEAQDRALRPGARRKLILATNIAETSLTIDGVRWVIDAGMARVPVQDVRLGIDRLELRRISRASARQRAGRAGRTAPGWCLRLWSRGEDARLEETETPEIHRVDLAATLLSVRAYGVRDIAGFRWFDPPRPEAVERAERLLRMLGAVEANGCITEDGRAMARLPVHPRLARLLLAGAREGLLREAASVAALLSEHAPSPPSRRRGPSPDWASDSDILDWLDALERNDDTADFGLDASTKRSVLRVRDELMRLGRDSVG